MSLRENSRSCSMVDAYVVRKRGYFGQFGGQYVPETLMPALHELEAAYDEAKEDPKFQEELESYNRHYGGRPTPLLRPTPYGPHRRGADLSEAGRPLPWRSPQVQQRNGSSPPRLSHGEEARDRGDRRGPAWSRHGDGRGGPRPARRGVYGRRRHPTSIPERVSHEAPRRDGASRRTGQPDAEGRHQRGSAGLGDEHREHVLSPRK